MKKMGMLIIAAMITGHLWAGTKSPVNPQEAEKWIRHCLPLPKEIKITEKVTVEPADLGILYAVGAGDTVKTATREFQKFYKKKTGVEPIGGKFKIVLKTVDADSEDIMAKKLKTCKNSDQAYVIEPEGESGLIISALTERGLFYGLATLRQLLSRNISKESVSVPLVTVLDWPDFIHRGFWNAPPRNIPYFSSMKINFMTTSASKKGKFTRGKPMEWGLYDMQCDDGKTRKIFDWARCHAMSPYAQITHLNYWQRYGLYDAYPELKGKGDGAYDFSDKKHVRPVPCASNPLLKKLLIEAIQGLAKKGVAEISVWQSEFEAECECEKCKKIGQCQAETDAIIAAWEEVKKQYPDLKLRIFFCLGKKTPDRVSRCLENLPEGVTIEKVYGWQEPYTDAARRGQKIIRYSGGLLCKTHATGIRRYPQSYLKRLKESHKLKLAGSLALNTFYSKRAPAYTKKVHDYNISGMAEWSWNLDGRSPKEFAVAWAEQQGFTNPEKVAEWLECMEKAEEVIAMKRRPRWFFTYEAAKNFRQGKPWGILSDKEINDGLAECSKALAIAEIIKNPELLAETRHVMAVLQVHQAAGKLSKAIQKGTKNEADRKNIEAALAYYVKTVKTAKHSLAPLMDILTVEPKTFAENVKKEQVEGWEKAEKEVNDAVKKFLKD